MFNKYAQCLTFFPFISSCLNCSLALLNSPVMFIRYVTFIATEKNTIYNIQAKIYKGRLSSVKIQWSL